MYWYLAMLALAPLIILPNWRKYRAMGMAALWEPKLRVWLVMMASSLATYIDQSPQYYLAICLFATWAVLDHPKSMWQNFIAWIYLAMSGLNVGVILAQNHGLHVFSSAATQLNSVWSLQVSLGWCMLAALFVWGAYDGMGGNRLARYLRDDSASHSPEFDS